jgi:hypothetical protein
MAAALRSSATSGPCTVEGSGVSGIDNCARGSMCWNVDPETNEGTCVDFCRGSEMNPTCTSPAMACAIANEGVLPLCLSPCEPSMPDCPDDAGCYALGNAFVCAATLVPGAHGESCSAIGTCAPGLTCRQDAARAPGCWAGCCADLCDLDAPDPAATCIDAMIGEMCLPLADDGVTSNVGVCGFPE